MQVGLKYHHFLLARHNGAYVHYSESVLDGTLIITGFGSRVRKLFRGAVLGVNPVAGQAKQL